MATNIVTIEDLQVFKIELLEELKKVLTQRQSQQPSRWLKSYQVRKLLNISPGTLQHLRVNGNLPFTKIGGVIFYDIDDIEKMIANNKQNIPATQRTKL